MRFVAHDILIFEAGDTAQLYHAAPLPPRRACSLVGIVTVHTYVMGIAHAPTAHLGTGSLPLPRNVMGR